MVISSSLSTCMLWLFSQEVVADQNSFVYTHFTKRCSRVSSWSPQKVHNGEEIDFILYKILILILNQEKGTLILTKVSEQ